MCIGEVHEERLAHCAPWELSQGIYLSISLRHCRRLRGCIEDYSLLSQSSGTHRVQSRSRRVGPSARPEHRESEKSRHGRRCGNS